MITGSASAPGTSVQIIGSSYATTAGSDSKFSFNVDFQRPDCHVGLLSPTGWLNVLVADCGIGTAPHGAWSAWTTYYKGDLVAYDGAVYLAEAGNRNQNPATSPDAWQFFSGKGDKGRCGRAGAGRASGGADGAAGATGGAGPTGRARAGERGRKAPGATGAGAPGPQGPAGPRPAGVTPRGAWDANTDYVLNDLATEAGATWRALRASHGEEPGRHAEPRAPRRAYGGRPGLGTLRGEGRQGRRRRGRGDRAGGACRSDGSCRSGRRGGSAGAGGASAARPGPKVRRGTPAPPARRDRLDHRGPRCR